LTDILVRRSGRRGLFGVLLALPITAVLAWYSYDYITPTDVNLGINAGPDWTPYRHGLTLQRYVMMLALQTPITLFNILYLDATSCDRSKTPVIIGALLFSVVLGVLYGHWTAEGQYKFL
jgi:hypothetical protein